MRYAEAHPLLGNNRLTWALVDENVASLRPCMVYSILAEYQLLGRRAPAIRGLGCPAETVSPDQRWHTDLMMCYFDQQWY